MRVSIVSECVQPFVMGSTFKQCVTSQKTHRAPQDSAMRYGVLLLATMALGNVASDVCPCNYIPIGENIFGLTLWV